MTERRSGIAGLITGIGIGIILLAGALLAFAPGLRAEEFTDPANCPVVNLLENEIDNMEKNGMKNKAFTVEQSAKIIAVIEEKLGPRPKGLDTTDVIVLGMTPGSESIMVGFIKDNCVVHAVPLPEPMVLDMLEKAFGRKL